jgi:hypothetical protein
MFLNVPPPVEGFEMEADCNWEFCGHFNSCYSVAMTLSVTERVRQLRQEISEISKESSNFLRSNRKDSLGLGEQERRVQRMREIKEELMSLTAWKKV